MSTFPDERDFFDGLRVLPRESEQLRLHLSRINHTLQTRYLIPAEFAELALQPDRSEDFNGLYTKEIQRIVSLLNNSSSTRRAMEVHVDPKKLLEGAIITYTQDENSKSVAPNITDNFHYTDFDSGGLHLGIDGPAQLTSPFDRKGILPCQNSTNKMRQPIQLSSVAADPATPAGALRTGLNLEDILSTTSGFVDSTARPPKDVSCLFSTPPEFKGFSGAPAYTPSESYTCSP